jgi:hypothetical protein
MRFSLGWNFNGLPFKSDHQKSDDLEFKPLTNLADRDKFIALDNKHDKFLKVSTRNIDLSDQHENRDKMYMQLDQLVPRQKIALPTVNRAAMLMPTVNMQEQISTQFGNKANDFSFMLSGRIKLDNQARKITFDLNGFKKIEKITLNDQELSNNSGHFIYEYPLGDKLPEQLEFKVYSAYPVFTLNLKPVQNGFIVSGAIPAVYQLSLDSNMFASQAGKTLNYSYKSSGAELDLMLFSR